MKKDIAITLLSLSIAILSLVMGHSDINIQNGAESSGSVSAADNI